MSYQLRDVSFELQAMSYEKQASRKCTRYKMVPAPADDRAVHPCIIVWLSGADLHSTLIESADYQPPVLADDTPLQGTIP